MFKIVMVTCPLTLFYVLFMSFDLDRRVLTYVIYYTRIVRTVSYILAEYYIVYTCILSYVF